MYASEPGRLLGYHICTKRLVQERADGAVIPSAVEHDHYCLGQRRGLIPHGRDPVLPPSSTCPRPGAQALRHVDWQRARALAAAGGGYLDGAPGYLDGAPGPAALGAENRGSRPSAPDVYPRGKRGRRRVHSLRTRGSSSTVAAYDLRSTTKTKNLDAPPLPLASLPDIADITDDARDAFDTLAPPSAAPAVAPPPPPAAFCSSSGLCLSRCCCLGIRPCSRSYWRA
jgi:hypothetical protein